MIDNLVDEDNDGIDDAIALLPLDINDTDGDGTPDFRDLDSDGDGFTDMQESGALDADGDGRADALVLAAAVTDTDGDLVPDHLEMPPLRTAHSGAGCSISFIPNSGASRLPVDPLLPSLALLAGVHMTRRRFKNKATVNRS